jgi:hypothetical protein
MQGTGRMRAFTAILYGLAVLGGLPAAGQEPAHIVVGPNILVGGDTAAPYVEPMIAVNPAAADNLVGVSMKIDTAGVVTVAVTSRDGGRTWHESPIAACGYDPWVAFLPSGIALMSCLPPGTGPDPVLVFRSQNGGATWHGPTRLPVDGTSFDHPTLVVDTTSGPRRGTTYLVSGQVARSASGRASLVAPALAASPDGGRTFSTPVRLRSTNVWSMVLSPVVLSDGSVGFGFVDYAVDARPAGAGVTLLQTPRLWWTQSTDGGRTLSLPHLIGEIEEVSRWGHVAVDGSAGPFRDRLYAVTDDFREGAGGVFVYHSADHGETWSPAVRVSRPDTAREVRRVPALAVNSRGEVLVAWFDPGEEPGRPCWRLVASASLDGGGSFLTPVPVAEARSCNDQPGNVVEHASGPFDVGARWPAGGDYFGLAAHPDGSFSALWSDSRSGILQLWTARIHVRIDTGLGQPSRDEVLPWSGVSGGLR